MESLTLKPRQPVEEDIECWDDDGDLQGMDNLQFRNASTTTIGSANASYHRESISSRMSIKSDGDSIAGDNDWQVLLPTDDEASTNDAIASAKTAGIPIPANVPTSALLGGTIKRLGGRKIKKAFDDWDEDLELPKPGAGGLKLKKNEPLDFPDVLRHFSGECTKPTSPSKPKTGMTFMERMESARKDKPVLPPLDKFRDDNDYDFFGDVPTIKVAKSRSPHKPINFEPPKTKPAKDVENIEEDLEFPADGEPLRLSIRKEAPKTPASQQDDIDMEWAEGSLGTRFGGTRRDGRSNPGSSMSAFSPSSSSCFTAESEDEGLDGLVLPEGPLKFDEVLKKRLEDASPDIPQSAQEKPAEKPTLPKDDFFTGIELGDGDVFDSGKLTLNRNIKHKATRQTSPKRPATTLTFTNKVQPGHTKIPQPQKHERARTRLEPVSESGGPISSRSTRPQSRMSGHAAHSSLSNIPTPSTPSSHSAAPSTPSRRGLTSKASQEGLRGAPPSNPAQYLKAKRSMPVMAASPARNPTTYQRPPSRGDYGNRQGLPPRPKTPTDRAESSLANARKPPIPFLPAGTSSAQSHHISIKSSRQAHRPGSSDSNENQPLNRPLSRLSNAHYRPTTPTGRRDVVPESLAREAASKRTVTKPIRRRAFGDGTELEVFDDLPTSATTESKFVRQPIARGAPKSVQMRSKLGLSNLHSTASANVEPPPSTPATPLSPPKQDFTPRFARDTNASRMAREQRIGSVNATLHATPSLPTVRESGPLSTLSTNFRTQISNKPTASPSVARVKRGKGLPQKPQLIKQIGDAGSNPKTLKGMSWNPTLFRWEGNENALAPFDAPLPPPQSPKTTGPGGKPAPALIANVGATKGVQVVGGMVFDPQRMCWLKMGPSHPPGRDSSNPRSPDTIDEDEDPFAGLDDLEDTKDRKSVGGLGIDDTGTSSKALADEEWPVGEEFDVGPEFVKRQRTEEEKWRRKVEAWVGKGMRGRGGDEWKWALRGHVEKLTVL
ncbi:MAG: hypothetical protein Q9166_004853 [cf. Caloplaca sp. 2 TL-2023]